MTGRPQQRRPVRAQHAGAGKPAGDTIPASADVMTQTPDDVPGVPALQMQISLAWMLRKNDFIVPIPGSRKLERIQENLGAAEVDLTDEQFARIETELANIKIHGNRTDEDIAKLRSMQ